VRILGEERRDERERRKGRERKEGGEKKKKKEEGEGEGEEKKERWKCLLACGKKLVQLNGEFGGFRSSEKHRWKECQ
jgi:hypothetical protein